MAGTMATTGMGTTGREAMIMDAGGGHVLPATNDYGGDHSPDAVGLEIPDSKGILLEVRCCSVGRVEQTRTPTLA